MAICFLIGLIFGIFATGKQFLLSSQEVQQNNESLVISPDKPIVSFIRLINGINSLIEVYIAVYFFSVVLREIYVWIFSSNELGIQNI